MAQHAELTEDRWSGFTLDQQILMIANEMNRASGLILSGDIDRVKNCYERVLQLTDLTVRAQTKSTLRWELLRWRDLIAEALPGTDHSTRRAPAGFPMPSLLHAGGVTADSFPERRRAPRIGARTET